MATTAKVLFYGGNTLDGDTRIEDALAAAAVQLANVVTTWGAQWPDAVACLAAHMLLINPAATDCAGGDGLTRGQITSEGSGADKLSYKPLTAASLVDQDLARTNAGMSFLRMQAALPTIGFALIG